MNNKGITLIALVVTIIVLIILAAITINYGKKSINNAKLETLKTNMMLIKAKAKEYNEEANFKVGTGSVPSSSAELENYLKPGKDYLKEKGLTNEQALPSNLSQKTYQYVVELTDENLNQFGLKDIKKEDNEKYYIGFNIAVAVENSTTTKEEVEVFNTKGYDNKYSLTEIEAISE